MAATSTSRRDRRRWLQGLSALPLLLLALAWWAGSEPALRLLARQAEEYSDGRLHVSGVHGSLYGPLRIDALSLSTQSKRIELTDLRLDWSPRALWRRHLQVTQLALAQLRVTQLRPSNEPLAPPESLALPLSLAVPRASLARLVIKTTAGERVLSGIEFSLDKPMDRYRLTLRDMVTPWGRLQARASMAQATPFALEGEALFQHHSVSARAHAAGTLARVALHVAADLAAGHTAADLEITPFAPRLLAAAHIGAHGLDAAAWKPQLPTTAIDFEADLASRGATGFAGALELNNAKPGSWDRERLPLKAVSARLSGTTSGLDLDELRLDLGRAGHFKGHGRLDAAGLTLSLDTQDFDPGGLHGRLRSLRLAGALQLKADAGQQHLAADLGERAYRLRLDADLRERVLRLNAVRLTSPGGSLSLYGSLQLDAARPFELAGALDGFDPSAFGDYPQAHIHASFSGAGQIMPQPEAALRFAIADSRFRHQPLTGQGGLRLSARRLWDSDVALRLAGNRLQLKGAFGAPGDHLDFLLQAERLQAIHPALTGRIHAAGQLTGSLAAPSGTLELHADGLGRGRDFRLHALEANARLEQGLDGDMQLQARLSGLDTPHLHLLQASLAAQGKRGRHDLRFSASNPAFDLTTELAGSLHASGGALHWSGQVLNLQNRGRFPLELHAPASLELAPGHVRLSAARFDFLGAAFNVPELSVQAGGFASQGEFKGLSVTSLATLGAWPAALDGDLSLGGEWAVSAHDSVNGHLALWRERGDLVPAAQPPIPLGLGGLKLLAEATDNRLQARLQADGSTLGRLRATAATTLSRRDGAWGVRGDAPFQASAELDLRSLAWAAPLLEPNGAISVDGTLQARLSGGGTLAAPRLSGNLGGEGLKLAWPDQGLDLHDGHLQAELRQDRLELSAFSLRGGDGRLTGQGSLALAGDRPEMHLALQADKLQVSSRPDRLLVLSGNGRIAMAQNKVQVDASLKADHGQFELAREDTPQASTDVVVLGRETPAHARGLPYGVRLNLALDLGEHFSLQGRGLDAQLGGTVRVSSEGGAPLSANGSIRVLRGTYSAYGQRLAIERGNLNFQGPLDNPGLNIVAMRKDQAVEAGVAITGSVQAPEIKLVSKPAVSDTDKLAWLVLGHAMTGSGAQEFDALQLAAGALLGAGESVSLQQRIAHAAGLEEVGLKGAGSLESTVLTLGKRLSSKAYLSYEQGLAGTDTLVKINYSLSRRLSVRAQAGTTPAVDLFYTFSFD
jgi:translocation and assembly module TamB